MKASIGTFTYSMVILFFLTKGNLNLLYKFIKEMALHVIIEINL